MMQPPGRTARVADEEHDRAVGHPAHLGEAAGPVGPVVHREHRHGGTERPVTERECLSVRPHRRRRARRALPHHHRRRLDGDDEPVPRLVGARAGPHIHHRGRSAQGGQDGGRDPRLLPAALAVLTADAVIHRPRGHGGSRTLARSQRRDGAADPVLGSPEPGERPGGGPVVVVLGEQEVRGADVGGAVRERLGQRGA
jgi:hypothetical protein